MQRQHVSGSGRWPPPSPPGHDIVHQQDAPAPDQRRPAAPEPERSLNIARARGYALPRRLPEATYRLDVVPTRLTPNAFDD